MNATSFVLSPIGSFMQSSTRQQHASEHPSLHPSIGPSRRGPSSQRRDSIARQVDVLLFGQADRLRRSRSLGELLREAQFQQHHVQQNDGHGLPFRKRKLRHGRAVIEHSQEICQPPLRLAFDVDHVIGLARCQLVEATWEVHLDHRHQSGTARRADIGTIHLWRPLGGRCNCRGRAGRICIGARFIVAVGVAVLLGAGL
mmetsp:Transcript_11603/g.32026  ORF Transcript_11603/g.32026 Transcript_11603/m.32026 type:complete len:200 (-) Transcript_11603:227-826(-)